MWEKIIHAQSSMEPSDDQYSMFIGRWQILHEGHKQLFNQVLAQNKKLLICVRDCAPDERNPKSSEEVKQEITNYFQAQIAEGTVTVIIIPDIDSVNFGRGVGYDVVEYVPPTEIAQISASQIRAAELAQQASRPAPSVISELETNSRRIRIPEPPDFGEPDVNPDVI